MDRLRFAMLCFCLAGGLLSAQAPASVAGTWDFVVESPKGKLTETMTLTQNGDKITGTDQRGANTLPVTGTLKGKKLTLETTMTRGRETVKYTYDGTVVSATEMSGSMTQSNEAPDRLLIWSATKKK